MKKYFFTLLAVAGLSWGSLAQSDVLTLRECIELGIGNNLSLQAAGQETIKADIGLTASRMRLLPVIQAYGNFADHVDPMETVTDGSALSAMLGVDMPYMLTTGLRYSSSGGVQFSMPLYDHTIFSGMAIAGKMREIAGYSIEKAKEDLTVEITRLYYLGQTTREQIGLLEENIDRLERLQAITVAFHDNDMALEVDVKRVGINLENLRVQLDNSRAMYRQQLNLLRYMLNLSPETEFDLEPIRENGAEAEYLYAGVSSDLYELKLLDSRQELLFRQKQAVNRAYLPTLSLVGQTAYTNFTDHFDHYFHTHRSNKWYNHTYWGLSLKIPVFDGLAKNNRIRQVRADARQLEIVRRDTEQKLGVQYANALSDWNNQSRNLKKQIDNFRLSEDVYRVTTERYREGMASMTEVLQDELRVSEARGNYISALYGCMAAELILLKLTGQLDRLTR